MKTGSPLANAHLRRTLSRCRINQLIGFLCLLSANSVFASEILLQDNFAGTQINTNLWTVTLNNLNFGNSSVVQNNGIVTLTDRGMITTVQGFSNPISISGSFQFLQHEFEILTLVTRTTAEPSSSIYGEKYGLALGFYKHGAVQFMSFTETDNYSTIAATNYGAFQFNQWYNFVFEDNGTNASVTLDSFPTFSTEVDPALGSGDRLSIYDNGQYNPDGTKSTAIGPITISSVPEPSTFALLLLSGAGSLWFLKRHKG